MFAATDFAPSVKELEGTGVVLHDFDGADEQELTVFAEQQVRMSMLKTCRARGCCSVIDKLHQLHVVVAGTL